MKEPKYITVWNSCLQMIKDVIPQQAFSTWFTPLKSISL
ncbi:MAG: DnaA N-terminal domain-containing protein, partial [Bacteroidia bacterium]|nr:DnaA N-terminal domain-containing protein [Bacteroidia bacterium]